MSFWTPEGIKTIVGGTWLARGRAAPADAAGLSIDSRSVRPGQVFAALRGERTDGHAYLGQAAGAGAWLALVDAPERIGREALEACAGKTSVLAVASVGDAMLRLASAYRRTLDGTKVVSVSGSNGKTTTSRLLQSVLSASLRGTSSPKSFNNSIGVPLTVLAARRGDQFLVCEVGTNHPGELAPLASIVRPDVAVITSVGREHLEGFGGIDGVIHEESSILAGLEAGGIVVVNADSPELLASVRGFASRARAAQIVGFGFSAAADIRITSVESSAEGVRFGLKDRTSYRMRLLGRHNALNAAAAIAVARRLGVPNDAIEGSLATATGPDMRLQPSTVGDVFFVNDAYNANPESVLAALAVFAELPADRRRVVVLGDMLELGEGAPDMHREIGRAVATPSASGRVDLALLAGPLMGYAAEAASRAMPAERIVPIDIKSGDWPAQAAAYLRPGDLVLLKGSRGIGVDRVLVAYAAMLPPAVVTPASTKARA
jgi:UDP-N-acetylmuramoyl-tripeptide--D-alanyl-D-alanine ligase